MDGEKNRENKFLWMWKKEMKKQKQTVPAFGEANWKSIEVQQHSIILYDGWFFKHIDSDSIGARFFASSSSIHQRAKHSECAG